jgi:hypothetical protein
MPSSPIIFGFFLPLAGISAVRQIKNNPAELEKPPAYF